MASVVQICNLALSNLGSARIIDVITENTAQARACNAVYELLRDEALSAHPWNFAIKRSALALTAVTPAFNFSLAYAKPSDYLRAIRPQKTETVYKVEGDYILSNEDSLKIKYIAKITDPTKFSASFVTALAARIASEICIEITKSRPLAADLYKIYLAKISTARSIDAQEGTPEEFEIDEWDSARVGGTPTVLADPDA